jgi:hypothetical protein
MRMAPFATLINQKVLIPPSRTQYVAVDKEHLVDFPKPTLRALHVDADRSLVNNPGIAEAIKSGDVATAVDHYDTYGDYEHRMPHEIKGDDEWYLTLYPDVKDAALKGLYPSALGHYCTVGFEEGRIPHANFSLCMSE